MESQWRDSRAAWDLDVQAVGAGSGSGDGVTLDIFWTKSHWLVPQHPSLWFQ